jgi:hypothetical protein
MAPQFLVREYRPVIPAPVQRDVDGIPKGSQGVGVPDALTARVN